jgi:hypothetical protein
LVVGYLFEDVYEVQEAEAEVMLKVAMCHHMRSCHQTHLYDEREKTSVSVAPARMFGVVIEAKPTERQTKQVMQARSVKLVTWTRGTRLRVESAWDTDDEHGSACRARRA